MGQRRAALRAWKAATVRRRRRWRRRRLWRACGPPLRHRLQQHGIQRAGSRSACGGVAVCAPQQRAGGGKAVLLQSQLSRAVLDCNVGRRQERLKGGAAPVITGSVHR